MEVNYSGMVKTSSTTHKQWCHLSSGCKTHVLGVIRPTEGSRIEGTRLTFQMGVGVGVGAKLGGGKGAEGRSLGRGEWEWENKEAQSISVNTHNTVQARRVHIINKVIEKHVHVC